MLTFRYALLTMRLHGNMRVQMVQSAVSFLAPVPAAFVHALDLLVASARSLVLLGPGNRHETEDLRRALADAPVRRLGRSQDTHLITASALICGGSRLLVRKDASVVAWGDGRVVSVASPVGAGLGVDVVSLRVAVGHILCGRGVRACLWVRVLRWALRRDRGVYWNITVRFDLLGILLGILMGSAILKIQ